MGKRRVCSKGKIVDELLDLGYVFINGVSYA